MVVLDSSSEYSPVWQNDLHFGPCTRQRSRRIWKWLSLVLPAVLLVLLIARTPLRKSGLLGRTRPSENIQASLEIAHAGNVASPFRAHEFQQQHSAKIAVGADVGIYAVGSSNVLWMNWIDQVHLLIRRLGFNVPTVNTQMDTVLHPTQVQICDDTPFFAHLETARLGRIGWNSWDFSFDAWEGCKDGFRPLGNHSVMCRHGEGCHGGYEEMHVSDIARDAAKSNITLVSTWFNDHKQFISQFRCVKGERILRANVSEVAIPSLLSLIRSIHKVNPHVWVLVIGEYPVTAHWKVSEITLSWLRILNQRVKVAVEAEPRTLFVDYDIPVGPEIYQRGQYGHPNCQGSKLMANAVVRRLFDAHILARGLRWASPLSSGILSQNCSRLTDTECHTSAFCWVDPSDETCKAYGGGSRGCFFVPSLKEGKCLTF